ELAREMNVGSALEKLRKFTRKSSNDFFMPCSRKTAAHSEIKKFKGVPSRRFCRKIPQQRDLGGQALTPFRQRSSLIKATEIQLINDCQHVNLETHHMHLRPVSNDFQLFAACRYADETPLITEYTEEINEVALDET